MQEAINIAQNQKILVEKKKNLFSSWCGKGMQMNKMIFSGHHCTLSHHGHDGVMQSSTFTSHLKLIPGLRSCLCLSSWGLMTSAPASLGQAHLYNVIRHCSRVTKYLSWEADELQLTVVASWSGFWWQLMIFHSVSFLRSLHKENLDTCL